MTTIWKFAVPITFGEFELTMPAGARMLCVQTQGGDPFLWAEVDPDALGQPIRFLLAGSAAPMDPAETREYVGTFQRQTCLAADPFFLAFHLYRVY